MVEIRLHGRGGQGAVIASLMMARAAFLDGRYAQAFPQFGVERRGAPVTAYARFDDARILWRTQVYEPDHVIVLDGRLIGAVPIASGLKRGGTILVNSPRSAEALGLPEGFSVVTVDASAIAARLGLGTPAQPIINSPMVAAFAAATGCLSVGSVLQAVRDLAPAKADENAAAAREAFDQVGSVAARIA